MKAIGAIAISGSLTSMEIAAAGIIVGIIFLLVGLLGGMKYIKRLVPNWLIRGIQLGLAFSLVQTAFNFLLDNIVIGFFAVSIIIIFYFLPTKDISSLIVFGILVLLTMVYLILLTLLGQC